MLTSRSNGGDGRHVAGRGAGSGPRVGSSKPGDHPEGRRLARAGRPEHREELAVVRPRDRCRPRPRPGTSRRRIDERGHAPTGVVVAEALDDPLEADRDRPAAGSGAGSRVRVGIANGTSDWGSAGCVRGAAVRVRRTVPCPRSVSSRVDARSVRRVIDFAPWSPVGLPRRVAPVRSAAAVPGLAIALAACDSAAATPTPPIVPGGVGRAARGQHHRQGLLVPARRVDLVPGETVLLHVINGGLEVHEAVIGDAAVQDAWEVAEAATAGRRPGRRPWSACRPSVAGLRIVVALGRARRRRLDGPGRRRRPSATPWVVGCHIPGHWARGMQVPVRWVVAPSRRAR